MKTQECELFFKRIEQTNLFSEDGIHQMISYLEGIFTSAGLNLKEKNRVLVAVSQMCAKGVITKEELKLQMREAGLPESVACLIKACKNLGYIKATLSEEESMKTLDGLLDKGSLSTIYILPEFISELKNSY